MALYRPKAFETYACARTLVCCRHPVRAPVPSADRERIRGLLAEADSESARLIAETLDHRIEGEREPLWRIRDGRCVNLDVAAKACEVHGAGGLAALPGSCRNYPRWVTAFPDRVEIAFALTCPTAAHLLVARADEPWALERDPAGDTSPYHATSFGRTEVAWDATRTVPIETALAVRGAWWSRIDAVRTDAFGLTAVLADMEAHPLDPSAHPGAGLETALGPGEGQAALAALDRMPDADAYESVRDETFAELVQPMSSSAFTMALDAAPELVAAFMSAGVQWAGVHDPRPVHAALAAVVRRTVLAVRLVDALCARVPYRIARLFGDAFSAASFVLTPAFRGGR